MTIRYFSTAFLFGGLVGLITFAVSGLGCAPPPPDSSNGASIIGGRTDTADSSVVALYASTAKGGALCTASVIAPTVLLTAAHCVLPSEVGAGATFTVLPSNDLHTSTTEQLSVKETHYDPSFDISKLQNGHDVAVVILDKPTTLKPLPVNYTVDASTFVGKSVRLVGYGVSNGTAQTGAGVKRTVTAPVDSVDARLVQIGGNGKDTCQGDSGGPALATVNGADTIIGITSFGESGCGAGGYDTRIELYHSFLQKYVATAGSASAPGSAEREPNDESSQANELAEGNVDGALTPQADLDWFTFTVPGPSSYSLALRSARSSATFRVYKMSPSGALSSLGVADESDGVRTFDKASAAGGIYYVKVYDDGAKHTDDGSYTLALE